MLALWRLFLAAFYITVSTDYKMQPDPVLVVLGLQGSWKRVTELSDMWLCLRRMNSLTWLGLKHNRPDSVPAQSWTKKRQRWDPGTFVLLLKDVRCWILSWLASGMAWYSLKLGMKGVRDLPFANLKVWFFRHRLQWPQGVQSPLVPIFDNRRPYAPLLATVGMSKTIILRECWFKGRLKQLKHLSDKRLEA